MPKEFVPLKLEKYMHVLRKVLTDKDFSELEKMVENGLEVRPDSVSQSCSAGSANLQLLMEKLPSFYNQLGELGNELKKLKRYKPVTKNFCDYLLDFREEGGDNTIACIVDLMTLVNVIGWTSGGLAWDSYGTPVFGFWLGMTIFAAAWAVSDIIQLGLGEADKLDHYYHPLFLPVSAARYGVHRTRNWKNISRRKTRIKKMEEKLEKSLQEEYYAGNDLILKAVELFKTRKNDLAGILDKLGEYDKEIAVSYIYKKCEKEINTASVEELLELRNFLIKNNIRNPEVDKAYAKKLLKEIPDRFKKQDQTLRILIDELKDNPKKHNNLMKMLKLEIGKGFRDLENVSLAERHKVGGYFVYCESIGFTEESNKHRKEFGEKFVDGLKGFCPRGPQIENKYLKQKEEITLPLDLTLEEWIKKRRFLSREDIRTAGRETSPDGCYITLQHGFELLLNKADELPEQEMPYLHEYIESVVIPEIELGLRKRDGIFSKKYSRKILITYMDQFRELARQTKIFKLESKPVIPHILKKETIEELLPTPPKTKTKTEQAEEEGAILQ